MTLASKLSSRSPQVQFPPGKLRADGLNDSEGKGAEGSQGRSEWVEEQEKEETA